MSPWSIALAFILVANADPRSLPSEVDLRAAYCIGVTQPQVEDLRPLANDPEIPEEARMLIAEVIEEVTGRLRRLRLYVLPRIPYLEHDGMAIALKRGQEDWSSHERHVHQCAAQCPSLATRNVEARSACEKRCAESPFTIRFQPCDKLT